MYPALIKTELHRQRGLCGVWRGKEVSLSQAMPVLFSSYKCKPKPPIFGLGECTYPSAFFKSTLTGKSLHAVGLFWGDGKFVWMHGSRVCGRGGSAVM